MEYVRRLLGKDLVRVEENIKGAIGDLYFYKELDPYLDPKSRSKKVDFYSKKIDQFKKARDEMNFILELMDKADIDHIYNRKDELISFRTCQMDIETYEVK